MGKPDKSDQVYDTLPEKVTGFFGRNRGSGAKLHVIEKHHYTTSNGYEIREFLPICQGTMSHSGCTGLVHTRYYGTDLSKVTCAKCRKKMGLNSIHTHKNEVIVADIIPKSKWRIFREVN